MKRLFALLAALCFALPVFGQTNSFPMLTAVTTTSAACSATNRIDARSFGPIRSFSASGTTSAGAGSATVIVYGSNLGTTTWVGLGTITLTLATTITADTNTGGFISDSAWQYLCARVSAISGTGAAVTATGANK